MPFIKVDDSDGTVVSVTRVAPAPEAGFTVYDEAWTGPLDWDSEFNECKRNGPTAHVIKKKVKKKNKSKKKRELAHEFIDDFEGTNLENFDDGTWTQANMNAIRDDADINRIMELSVRGNLEEMKAIIDNKATTNPWFKPPRKTKLSDKLQDLINKASEL